MDAAVNRLARNIRRIAHLDLPGGGQVVVQDGYAYVGHMKPPYGPTILDVKDPKNPRIVSEIRLHEDSSHTHKVRVAGDLMVTNVEQKNGRESGRERGCQYVWISVVAEKIKK